MKKKFWIIGIAALIFSLSIVFSVSAKTQAAENFNVKLSFTQTVYSGSVQKPIVTVTDSNGKALAKDAFTVSYSNEKSVNAGDYTVSVTENESGEIQNLTYKITPKTVRFDVSVTLEYTRAVCTGKQYKPKANVVYNGVTLKEGVDYYLTYKDNVEPGSCYVSINGINNFCETTKRCFSIIPGPMQNLRFTTSTTSSVKINWKRNLGSDGYEIYIFDEAQNKYVYCKTIDGGKYEGNTIYNLTYATNYKFRVRAFADFNNTRYYGDFCEVKTYTTVPKYTGKITLKRLNAAEMMVSLTKASGCSGYQFAVSHDPSFKTYTYYFTNNSRHYVNRVIHKLSKNKIFYVKARLFVVVDGKTIYGDWGSAVCDYKYSPTVKASKKPNSSWLDFSFSKSPYGHGYQIICAEDKDFKKGVKYYNFKGLNSTSGTLKYLDSKKGYYVKVRVYTELVNGYTYSNWSGVVNTGYRYELATYTSSYVNNKNRTTNLTVASKAINGVVIQPGQSFNFNNIVGPRTSARGYKKATVFIGTSGTAQELGGGICQVSSTIFNTALYANVKIDERHQHSQRVTYVPLGRDAAISGNSKNFRWTNNTSMPIEVVMTVKNGKITCTFYTFSSVSSPNVSLNVSSKNGRYTLTRKVGGKVNYTATSKY